MKKKIILLGILAGLGIAALAWAGTPSRKPYGICAPRLYNISTYGSTSPSDVSSYYFTQPTLSSNDEICGIAASQTLTNKTITSPTINSITFSAGTLGVLEGTTANDYETTISVTDPTADRTFTIPNYSGTAMLSTLSTNAPEAANSVWGASGSIVAEGSSANDFETSISFTNPTADRTVTVPDANVNLGSIANSLLAAPKSYTMIALTHDGAETSTLDPVFTFQMPFAATLTEVSATARNIDPNSTDETYTVDVEEAGTTVLSSAISITADNTPVVGTVSDSAIADNAKIEVVLTLGGTTPSIDDLTVLLTFAVTHTT